MKNKRICYKIFNTVPNEIDLNKNIDEFISLPWIDAIDVNIAMSSICHGDNVIHFYKAIVKYNRNDWLRDIEPTFETIRGILEDAFDFDYRKDIATHKNIIYEKIFESIIIGIAELSISWNKLDRFKTKIFDDFKFTTFSNMVAYDIMLDEFWLNKEGHYERKDRYVSTINVKTQHFISNIINKVRDKYKGEYYE